MDLTFTGSVSNKAHCPSVWIVHQVEAVVYTLKGPTNTQPPQMILHSDNTITSQKIASQKMSHNCENINLGVDHTDQ